MYFALYLPLPLYLAIRREVIDVRPPCYQLVQYISSSTPSSTAEAENPPGRLSTIYFILVVVDNVPGGNALELVVTNQCSKYKNSATAKYVDYFAKYIKINYIADVLGGVVNVL